MVKEGVLKQLGYTYAIHPSIGVARVGNSTEFYLAPDAIGGLPFECDAHGNPLSQGGQMVTVDRFKDPTGAIRRQGASFKVFRYDDAQPDAPPVELTLASPDVKAMAWTVHLANKKATWYQFSELQGDVMLGADNTYQHNQVPLRNAATLARQKLIIDPGPRKLSGPRQQAQFDRHFPAGYTHGHFPNPNPSEGTPINTLGAAITDDHGRLVVIGAFGHAGGDQSITTFAGADSWHDDVGDGPVTCQVTLQDGTTVPLKAWVVVGSPKFAPELVNVVTLDDIAFDVSVRYQNLLPDLYAKGAFNLDYVVNFGRDIEPIIRRPLDYLWVANVPSMIAFAAPPFDPRDNSAVTQAFREEYFTFFRQPGSPSPTSVTGDTGQINQLWSDGATHSGVPMMPMNSGSNSVSNSIIDKFLTLTETQYFMLAQWARGKFTTDSPRPIPGVHDLDRASIGNCVGAPMCPGIEVTWSTRNPALYGQPYQIAHRHEEAWYYQHGLDPHEDETLGGGCEPGDLTKRMAIPWQADFFDCTVQFVNFSDPAVNKTSGIPEPPAYYSYWWPAQSPMYVMAGANTPAGQKEQGVPAGLQVYYPRGINSFTEMITAWSYLGFIVNQNNGPSRSRYPYFTEVERDDTRFEVANVAVGGSGNYVNTDDQTFFPIWYLKSENIKLAGPGVRPMRQRRR